MEKFKTLEERLKVIKSCCELSLAIEGKYTNLRIWTGFDGPGKHSFEKHDTIFMRLDKCNNYSVPLSEETFNYLEKLRHQ